MTARFVTSAPIERSFQRDKSWQHPSRREWIHGRVHPKDEKHDPLAKVFVIGALVIALFFAVQEGRMLLTQHRAGAPSGLSPSVSGKAAHRLSQGGSHAE